MKTIILILLALFPVFSFAGCSEGHPQDTELTPGDDDNNNDDNGNDNEGETPSGNGRVLIAWFSRWGNTDYPDNVDASTGASILINDGERLGTTEQVARYIRSVTGGDLHLIHTVNAYPVDFDDVRDQNHAEQAAGTLPELADRIENMEQYDIIFIGYPNWSMDIPRPVASFLSAYDFSGKTVIPFCTHDGYGASGTFRSVKELATGADVLEGYAVEASDVSEAEAEVHQWLDGLGIEWGGTEEASVSVTVGGHTLSATWLDTPIAREIQAMFPLTVTLGRYEQREFYGSMPSRPENSEEGQLHFENGDITYCPSNNTIAIFYGQADDPDMGQLTMRVIPIGHVTSDLGIFDELDSRMEFTFDNQQ